MAQDHGHTRGEDNVVVLRATPEEFRDEPAGGRAAPVASLRGQIAREEPVTAAPAAAMEDGQVEPRWRRPALVLAGLAPLAALAVPAVHRPLARALPAGIARLNAAWQAGSRQVADATQAAPELVTSAWRRRREQRAELDRARTREAERQAELLVERLGALNRALAERNRPRGGLLRRARPVLLGLVLGGGLGLLYAPRPGAGAPARRQRRAA